MQPMNRKEPQLRRISSIESINKRKQEAPNIAPLGEISAEKIGRLFGQKTPERVIKTDPAPSRIKYKIHRMWLSPIIKRTICFGLPTLLMFMFGTYFLSNDSLRLKFNNVFEDAKLNIQARPEFQIELMKIEGASEALAMSIRKSLKLNFPVSSFKLDLLELKNKIQDMQEVKSASLFLRPGGLLEVDLIERIPLIIWRNGSSLEMIDAEGEISGILTSRLDRLDLPLFAGDGAKGYILEALNIYKVAEPISERLRGLRRMGDRRWDMILDRNQIIQLPEFEPINALKHVLVLNSSQNILSRDIVTIDMRDTSRPVLRLSDAANEIIRTSELME